MYGIIGTQGTLWTVTFPHVSRARVVLCYLFRRALEFLMPLETTPSTALAEVKILSVDYSPHIVME